MSWPQDIEWNLKKNRFWLKRMWLWLASALYFLIQGLFRYLYDCTTFGTNRYIENWSFFLKWGLDDAHTTSRSWDMKSALFSAFLGVFGLFLQFPVNCVILILSKLINYKGKWSFCLKWGLNHSHTTNRSRVMKSAFFRHFGALLGVFWENAPSPVRSPTGFVIRTIKLTKKSWTQKFPRKLTPTSLSRWSKLLCFRLWNKMSV